MSPFKNRRRGCGRIAARSCRVASLMLAALIILDANALAAWQGRPTAEPQDAVKLHALAVLEDILRESNGYENRALRVRVKAQIADVLWPSAPERAKELVGAAFDETQSSVDDASARRALRAEVVGVARKHDAQYTAQLIERLGASGGGEEQAVVSRDSTERISERGMLFMDTASELLRDGKQEQAVGFAQRSLSEGRSAGFLDFLEELGKHDRQAADRLFLDAVKFLREASSDPNDVLLLGLYLFSPGRLQFADVNGQLLISHGINFGDAPQSSPALVLPYLQAAGEVLARFHVVPGQPDYAGRVELKRFALQQLLALFDRYLPARSAVLRAELAQLNQTPSLAPTPRDGDAAGRPEPPFPGELSTAEVIEKIEQIGDPQRRNTLYFESAVNALGGGDFDGARTLAARITEAELKQSALGLIDFRAALKAVERGELDEAEKIAYSRLTPEKRPFVYHQIASAWLKQNNVGRAGEMTSAASAEAAKIDDPKQRALTYIYLAASLAQRDPPRALELAEKAIKDINSVGQFDPSAGGVKFRIRKPSGAMFEMGVGSGVGLLSVVRQLAKVEPYRTITLAQSVRLDEVRAFAVIEAARAVLADDKSGSTQRAGRLNAEH